MVSPEDALQSVRTAILLGAVLPDMKVEVDTLVADLAELVKVRSEIAAEREVLGRDLAALSQERTRMTVLVQERQRKQSETEKALDAERARAVATGPAGRQSQGPDRQDRAGDRILGPRGRGGPRPEPISRHGPEKQPRGAPGPRPALSGDCVRLGQEIAAAAAQRHQDSRIRHAGRLGRNRKGPICREPGRRAGDGALRWLGCVRRTVPFLRTTLDPERRRRISCAASGDGANLGRSRPVCADRGASGDHGGRAAVGRSRSDRFEPADPVYRVSKRRSSRRSKPMVGATDSEKVRG